MTLAELCDTSGNYIGQIEMGRRIPAFEKIEKTANALHIDTYRLFMQDIDKTEEQELKQAIFRANFPIALKMKLRPAFCLQFTAALTNRLRQKIIFRNMLKS
jgi:transcriptional regulator with XRE-family HTH domain